MALKCWFLCGCTIRTGVFSEPFKWISIVSVLVGELRWVVVHVLCFRVRRVCCVWDWFYSGFFCVCIPFLYVWVFVRVCAFASCAYTLCYVVVCIVVHFVCARSYSSPPLLDIKALKWAFSAPRSGDCKKKSFLSAAQHCLNKLNAPRAAPGSGADWRK